MKKINRLFVTCDFAPIIGGQSAYFTNLWADLSPSDDLLLLPHICTPPVPGPSVSHFRLPRGEWWLPRLTRTLAIACALLWNAGQRRPGEIHAGQLVSGGISALLVKRLFGIPYVLYIFGSDILEFSRSALQRAILRAIIGQSRRVITISHFTQDAVLGICPRAQISIVAPGVEDRFLGQDPETTAQLRDDIQLKGKVVFLTVGRLVKRKGHDVVIKALPVVLRAVPNVHYLIVGDGPCRSELMQLAGDLRVTSHLTWCGQIDDTRLSSFYGLADVFIMVSRILEGRGDAEGYGIVYLEANGAGVPVIAGRCGGPIDAVSEDVSGVFVDNPADPDQVADAMVKMARDSEYRRQLSEDCKEWAAQARWDLRRAQWNEVVGGNVQG